MAGVNGWYSAIGWTAGHGVDRGEGAGDERQQDQRHGVVAGGFRARADQTHADRDPGERQGEEHEQPARPAMRGGVMGRKPMATATAPTRTTLDRLQHAADDVPDEHRGRWIAIVRKRAMMPSVMSLETETAVPTTVLPCHQQQARHDVGDVLAAAPPPASPCPSVPPKT